MSKEPFVFSHSFSVDTSPWVLEKTTKEEEEEEEEQGGGGGGGGGGTKIQEKLRCRRN